jgi:peptide/nickel transport system substrate-binding protein
VKPTKADPAKAKKLLADAGYPNGFKVTFSFTNDRLPGDKDVGTTIAQMLTAVGIQVEANAQPGAVFFPANTRGDYSMTMSGWGTLTGESNYTLSSLAHSNDATTKLGAFNLRGYVNKTMDKLIEDAAVEMDAKKREKLLMDANALVATDRPLLAIASTVSAWGMKKGITIVPRSDEDTLAMNIRPAK